MTRGRNTGSPQSTENIVLKLALTNFFDLSNIRFDSGGPVKCLGPHDVFEECFSNPKGIRR